MEGIIFKYFEFKTSYGGENDRICPFLKYEEVGKIRIVRLRLALGTSKDNDNFCKNFDSLFKEIVC